MLEYFLTVIPGEIEMEIPYPQTENRSNMSVTIPFMLIQNPIFSSI